ncbi:MFS transporter [Azospirillum isscasi]|uniref:MFS transporter n=1 Tax=Azospirillum isscasi TaxID=3053926 RepID=A0ABU0WJ79_9PROT|nr:MFS transporter [Azospirillum isscasi]MDQ2103014.1 MFS transporter [Azospirillum isscasi]
MSRPSPFRRSIELEKTPHKRSLLHDPTFRNPWLAVEFSFLGMFIHVVAGSWLMAELTGSALFVSLIQTAYALPIVLFSIIAGVLADTVDRRSSMVWSLLVCLLASILLAATAELDLLRPWGILALIVIVGCGVALFTPPWQAALGDIAPRDQLVEAVSLHAIGANAMRTIGPSLGGLLVSMTGATVAFAAGALTYLPALLLMLFRPPKLTEITDRERFGSALVLGMRYLTVAPNLELLLLRAFFFSFAAMCVMAMLPLVAQAQYGLGAGAYGFLYGGYGLGAILGGIGLKRLRRHFSMDRIVGASFLLTGAAMLALALSRQLWQGLICTVLAGAAWLIVHSLHNSALQLSTPRWIAGRIVATFMTSVYLGLAIGGWVWGALAGWLGVDGALIAAAVAALIPFALALRFPLPGAPAHDLEPLAGSVIATDEQGNGLKGGPLYIVIEHDIDPVNSPSFLALMAQRRRHLTQLGASHWMVLRDIRNSGRWTESFYTASWSDYRRMMARHSAETAFLRKSAAELQRNGKEPCARLMLYEPVTRSLSAPILRT